MKVHWTETAERHLDAIFNYIARDSADYAMKAVDRITARSVQIGLFPYSGRKVSEFDAEQVREVYERPYRIIYAIKQGQIDIIAVLHDARELRHHT